MAGISFLLGMISVCIVPVIINADVLVARVELFYFIYLFSILIYSRYLVLHYVLIAYQKRYVIEMSEINLYEIIERIETLVKLAGAKTAILLDYSGDFFHHNLLSGIFANMGVEMEEVLCQEN